MTLLVVLEVGEDGEREWAKGRQQVFERLLPDGDGPGPLLLHPCHVSRGRILEQDGPLTSRPRLALSEAEALRHVSLPMLPASLIHILNRAV
jgi:hypothetical protein